MKIIKRIYGYALCLSVVLLFFTPTGSAQIYQPKNPRDTSGQKVFTDYVNLITTKHDLANRVRVEDLASFIRSAEAEAYPILAKMKDSARILLQFNCQPNKHDVKISYQGNPQESILQELYDAMKELPLLKTNGEVIFQLEICVRHYVNDRHKGATNIRRNGASEKG